jgi:hypothetical protein
MSIRNIFCWVKAAGEYNWQTFHLFVPIVLKSGSLNFLEPSELVQTWTGIALHLVVQSSGIEIWKVTPEKNEDWMFIYY